MFSQYRILVAATCATAFTMACVVVALSAWSEKPVAGKAHPTDVAFAVLPGAWSRTFLAMGDWGRAGAYGQRETAIALSSWAASIDSYTNGSIAHIWNVGDSFYDYGVTSAEDGLWKATFSDVYSQPAFTQTGRKWYSVLGNHDYRGNISAQVGWKGEKGMDRWYFPSLYYSVRWPMTQRAVPVDAAAATSNAPSHPGLRSAASSSGSDTSNIGAERAALRSVLREEAPLMGVPSQGPGAGGSTTSTGRRAAAAAIGAPADPRLCVAGVFIDTVPYVAKYRAKPDTAQMASNLASPASRNTTAQTAWIEEQLIAAAKACVATVVVGHHPLYSGGEHGDSGDLIGAIGGLLERYADVYVAGHDHTLQLLSTGTGTGTGGGGGAGGGVTHIVTGAGSKLRSGSVTTPQMVWYRDGINGFTAHSFNATHARHSFIGVDGSVLHSVAVQLKSKPLPS